MKTSTELTSSLDQITMSATPAYRSHSTLLFRIGRAIPTHKSQLSKFTSTECLCAGDIHLIDAIFNASETGLTADYQYTKSKTFVRLLNFVDFKKALTIALDKGFEVKKPM